jgi:adenosylcobinamide-GDP ribazoletransferase
MTNHLFFPLFLYCLVSGFWLMNSFLIALQFLTIIPVSHSFIADDKQLGYSTLYYPVIGLLIGSLLAFFGLFLENLSFQIQAAILLILWVMLTGALHLDGLADCTDAWVGGLGNKQRSLDIMKDPAAGPIAVVSLVLVLMLKWLLISAILENQLTSALILTPMLGRLAILILMLSTDYIRSAGSAKKIVENLPEGAVKVISLSGVIIGIYFLAGLPIIFMFIMLFVIAFQAKKRLGGVTGDIYGAAVELVEVSVLLGVVV